MKLVSNNAPFGQVTVQIQQYRHWNNACYSFFIVSFEQVFVLRAFDIFNVFFLNIKRYLKSICRFALFSCSLTNYCDTEWIYNMLSNSFIRLENIKFPIWVIANNSRIQTCFWIHIKWKRLRHWRHWHHSGFLKVHSQVRDDFWQLKTL